MADMHWDKRYLDGETPWDSGTVCGHLQAGLQDFGIEPCRALEVGCGTGTNAIWLAQQGFDVTSQASIDPLSGPNPLVHPTLHQPPPLRLAHWALDTRPAPT